MIKPEAEQSERVLSALKDLQYEAVMEMMNLSKSYSTSASEAAWRGDLEILGMHLNQLRLTVIEACKTYRAIEGKKEIKANEKEHQPNGVSSGRGGGVLPSRSAPTKAEGAGTRDDRGRAQGGVKGAVDHRELERST